LAKTVWFLTQASINSPRAQISRECIQRLTDPEGVLLNLSGNHDELDHLGVQLQDLFQLTAAGLKQKTLPLPFKLTPLGAKTKKHSHRDLGRQDASL
jgi:hypothetical protein